MRIAFLSQPRDAVAAGAAQHGSVAIVLMALARRLAMTAEVVVLAPDGGGPVEETTADGVRIRRAPPQPRALHRWVDALKGLAGQGLPHTLGRFYYPSYARWAAAAIAAAPPDILHVMSCAQFAPALRRRLPRTRLVAHLHDEMHLRIDRGLALARLGRFDAVLTCSDWLRGRLAERLPELAPRIHHVGNGVDTARFHPAADARPRPPRRLLFVGRVSPEKGVHVLARAFAALAPRHPGLELQLVGAVGLFPYALMRLIADHPAVVDALRFYGDGLPARLRLQVLRARTSYRDALLAEVPAALHRRLIWSGTVSHCELPGVYRGADILVSPSVCEEPFGIPIAEAMASGLPVVATDGGGVRELVADGESGLIVPRGDVAALAGALARLLDDPPTLRRLGLAGRSRARQWLDWDVAVGRLRRAYAG